MKATKLVIEDCGRGDERVVAVENGDDSKFITYTERDLNNKDRFTNRFWKQHGYRGRLEITDREQADETYTVNVR